MTKQKNKLLLIILLAFLSICALTLSLPKPASADDTFVFPDTSGYTETELQVGDTIGLSYIRIYVDFSENFDFEIFLDDNITGEGARLSVVYEIDGELTAKYKNGTISTYKELHIDGYIFKGENYIDIYMVEYSGSKLMIEMVVDETTVYNGIDVDYTVYILAPPPPTWGTAGSYYESYYPDQLHFLNEYNFYKDSESALFIYEFKLTLPNNTVWPKTTHYLRFGFSENYPIISGSGSCITIPNSSTSNDYYALHPDLLQTNWYSDKDYRYLDVQVGVARIDSTVQIYVEVYNLESGTMSKISPTITSVAVDWFDDFLGETDAIVAQNEALYKQIDELNAEIESLETEIESLNAEIAELNAEIESLNARIAELEQEIVDLKATHSDELEAKQKEYDTLMAQKLQLDVDLAKEKEKLKTATDEITRIEDLLDNTQTECLSMIREREKTIRDLETEKSKLEKENAELKKQLKQLESSSCSASMGATLPVAFTVLLSGFVIMGRIIYARKKEKF